MRDVPRATREAFGRALRLARTRAGFSRQAALARAIGVASATSVSDWEKGYTSPHVSVRPALAAALGEHAELLPDDGWSIKGRRTYQAAKRPAQSRDGDNGRLSTAQARKLDQLRRMAAAAAPSTLRCSLGTECQVRR